MSESKKRPLTFIFLLFLVWRGIHFYSKNDLNLSQTACMSAKNAPRECIYVRLAGAQKECSIANWPKRWHWKCEIGLFGCACDFNSKSGCHSPADDVSVGWKCDKIFPPRDKFAKSMKLWECCLHFLFNYSPTLCARVYIDSFTLNLYICSRHYRAVAK